MFSAYRCTKVTAIIGLAAAISGIQPAAAQSTSIKVASTAKVIFDNLPLFVASEGGMFKKHGLEVGVTHFRGGGEVVRAVSSGSMQIGMVATTAAIIAAGRGETVRVISGWSAPAYGIPWIVSASSPIKSIKDLVGKKVGISRPGSVSHTGLIAALEANGMADKVTIVPVGGPGDAWAAVKNGRVQATWHTAPYVYSLINGGDARILFDISDYLKEYQQGSLISTTDYLAENGATVTKFLRAAAEAMAFIENNPEKAAAMGAKATKMSEKMVLQTIKAMPKGFFRIEAPKEANFKGSLAEAMGTGTLKESPAYGSVVDRNYLP